MFVPIDLLKPILADLLTDGRPPGPRQPWLGLYTAPTSGRLIVDRVADEGPAAGAGLAAGALLPAGMAAVHRTGGVWGKSGVVRDESGCRCILTKKKKKKQ